MSKFRNLSPLECSYLANDSKQQSVFVNQFVLSGEGHFDLPKWRAAIIKAADANPGIKLKLKGFWGKRYWDSEGAYPGLHHYKSEWSAENEQDLPFNGKPINCRQGPCAEIHLLESKYPKIVFRTHHALCDGAATLHWMQEVFRALRNEPLKGSNGRKTEIDIVKVFSVAKNPIYPHPWIPVLAANRNKNQTLFIEGAHWQTFSFQGDYSKIMSKIIVILGKLAWHNNPEGHISFRIPSDLRRLLEDQEVHLGNMTGAFDFELFPDQNPDDIYKHLLNAKRKNNDLSVFPKNLSFANWLPDFAFKTSNTYFEKQYRQGVCNISAIISYLGKVDLDLLSCAAFKAKHMFGIPLPLEGVSVSLGMMLLNEQELSICLSIPKSLANHQQLNYLIVKILSELDDLNKTNGSSGDNLYLRSA